VCVIFSYFYHAFFLAHNIVWYGGIERVRYDLPVGNLFTCFWNWFNALYAVANILPHISAVIDSNAAQARIRDEIQRRPSIDVRDANGLQLEKGYEAAIKVHHLTFSYPSRPTIKSLDNVSMDIKSGQVTALVGCMLFVS
jgi:ATP-binding cassette, subfamily B (MDR/TAP), member 1